MMIGWPTCGRHLIEHGARHEVGGAAGGRRHDHADRLGGPALAPRARLASAAQQQRSSDRDSAAAARTARHPCIPSSAPSPAPTEPADDQSRRPRHGSLADRIAQPHRWAAQAGIRLSGEDDEFRVAAGLAAESCRTRSGRAGGQQLADALDRLRRNWMRSSASAAVDGAFDRTAWAATGSDAPGLLAAGGRRSARAARPASRSRSSACGAAVLDLPCAVKTCVPSGCSGLAISIGISNSGTKPCRTKIFFSFLLTKTATWPVRLTGSAPALRGGTASRVRRVSPARASRALGHRLADRLAWPRGADGRRHQPPALRRRRRGGVDVGRWPGGRLPTQRSIRCRAWLDGVESRVGRLGKHQRAPPRPDRRASSASLRPARPRTSAPAGFGLD